MPVYRCVFYTGVLFAALVLTKGIQVRKNQCKLNACEVLEIVNKEQQTVKPTSGCANDIQWRKLDRRLQAIEQPVWTISYGHSRWRQCSKGACRCDANLRLLKCWRSGLTGLSPDLVVPADLYTV